MFEITLSLRDFEINNIFNFHQNSRWQPNSHSQDKCVFAFYAEIQDDCQKWRESDFYEKSPVDSAYTPVSCRKFKMAGKSGEKLIFVKSCQYTLNTLGIENFDEIPLSPKVKEIEANLCFSIFGENSK